MESEKISFNFTNLKFSHSNSMRANNTTPTPAHEKKESNSTLKYATLATLTQQYSYKHGCGVGVSESYILEPSRNTIFKFEVGVASKSRFFRFSKVGNRSPYCFCRLRFTLNYSTFLHFISTFILLTRRKATEAL